MVGLTGIVVKSHGGADSVAFARAIALAAHAARRGLTAHIAQALRNTEVLDVFTYRRHGLLSAFRKSRHERRSREDGGYHRRVDPRPHRHRAPAHRRRRRNHRRSRRARRAPRARGGGRSPGRVDFIAFGTTTPDLIFPNCGVLLQARLGARGGPAFSVETACSGFMYALSIADKFVRAGEAKCALVVGAETLSRITDWNDRSTACCLPTAPAPWCSKPSDRAGHAFDAPARRWRLHGSAVRASRRLARVRRRHAEDRRSPWRATKCSRSR